MNEQEKDKILNAYHKTDFQTFTISRVSHYRDGVDCFGMMGTVIIETSRGTLLLDGKTIQVKCDILRKEKIIIDNAAFRDYLQMKLDQYFEQMQNDIDRYGGVKVN